MTWRDAVKETPPVPGVYAVLRANNHYLTSRYWTGSEWRSGDKVLWWAGMPHAPADYDYPDDAMTVLDILRAEARENK